MRHLSPTRHFILNHEIFGAIQMLEKEAVPEVRDALSTIKENYSFLSRYFISGGDDPERARLLDDMRLALDGLRYRNELLRIGKYSYFVPSHHLDMEGEASPLLALVQMLQVGSGADEAPRFPVLETLFDKLWQAPHLSDEEMAALRYVMTDSEGTFVARTLIGALYLGLSIGIEPSKYRLLLGACRHTELAVRVPALAALLLVSAQNAEELRELRPELWEEAQSLVAIAETEDLFAACNAIFSSYRTEEDHRIFVERIEPQLNDIAQKMNLLQGEDLFERLKDAERTGEVSDIERTVLDIQDELPKDRDLAFHTIHRMKGYPFFDSIPRFFLPWDKRHPVLDMENAAAFEKLLPMTFRDGMVCSSDCYSFGSIEYWKQFSEMLAGNLPDLTGVKIEQDADYYAKDFVFGLYRFLKLSSWGEKFPDPFKDCLDVLDTELMGRVYDMPHRQVLCRLVERLITLKEYDLGISMAKGLIPITGAEDTHLLRLLAVAHYRAEDYDNARTTLEQIVRVEGLTSAIALRLGALYERAGESDKAFGLYEQAHSDAPEDAKLADVYAQKLIERDRHEEALKVLYALFFATDGKEHGIVSLLAEALLMTGKAQEAVERLSELPAEDDKVFINKQIARIILGERSGALADIAPWCSEHDDRLHLFSTQVKHVLPAYGWAKTDISLILDALTIAISNL